MQQNFVLGGDPLSIDRIRSVLIRLEDTIIFQLIERAQFAHNPRIYEKGAFPELAELGFTGSWLEWFLKETETFHARARRYTSPDEIPFTTGLPSPVLRALPIPRILHPNTVSANPSILAFYVRSVVPRVTRQATLSNAALKRANGLAGDAEFEDDGNYGSAATIDVEVLQAISKRVHYGKFVAESKFQRNPGAFIPHILNPNPQALDGLITRKEVEVKLLQCLRKKAEQYAVQFTREDGEPLVGKNGERGFAGKIEVDGVVELYEHHIIPLTKEVEVEYLLHRLDGLSQAEIDALANSSKAT